MPSSPNLPENYFYKRAPVILRCSRRCHRAPTITVVFRKIGTTDETKLAWYDGACGGNLDGDSVDVCIS